jgi:ABC-type phosphonate transport system ATPase subunit
VLISVNASRPPMSDAVANGALLKVSNIETCYGLSQVLFGVSLAITPGEMVTLLGRNGMGKTTTVRSIMGLTRVAVLPHRKARHRARPGRPADFPEFDGARKPRCRRRFSWRPR